MNKLFYALFFRIQSPLLSIYKILLIARLHRSDGTHRESRLTINGHGILYYSILVSRACNTHFSAHHQRRNAGVNWTILVLLMHTDITYTTQHHNHLHTFTFSPRMLYAIFDWRHRRCRHAGKRARDARTRMLISNR